MEVSARRGRPGNPHGPVDDAGRTRIGKNLRRLRSERGLTQTALAGDAFSAAYVSTIEAGKRVPSRKALAYFADRLRVGPEELWSEEAATWHLELAQELSSKGSDKKARELLEKTLSILEQTRQLRPRALAVAHRELGKLEAGQGDLVSAARHLRASVEILQRSEAPAIQLTESYMLLGDVLARQRKTAEAMKAYRAGCSAIVEEV